MGEFVRLDDYLKLPREPQPWVIQHLVPIGGLVNVFGKPKTGKSWLALAWAQAVAAGDETWEGYGIHKPGPVAYIQVDTPREEWARRSELCWQMNATAPLYMADMWLVPQFPVNVLEHNDPTIRWLKAEMDRIQPVMVVIDTLREIHGGEEDSSTVMRNVLGSLVGACRPAAVVLVSHSRKDQMGWAEGEGEDLMDAARGSSYVAGRMDVVVKVSKRRMEFKGRATGLVQERIAQDPETGWISLIHDEDGSEQMLNDIAMRYPGLSVHAMAEKLARLQKFSISTATRRIHQWKKKKEQREVEG